MVTHNEQAHRFESEVEGGLALLEYRRSDKSMVITHTEVPEATEGKGVGAALVRAALDYAREAGLQVVPRCPFAATYIRRHPEYFDLLTDAARARLEEG